MVFAGTPPVNNPTRDETEPPIGPCTHELPTPTELDMLPGLQGHNRGITPRSAYRYLLPRKQPPQRRLIRKMVAVLTQHSADLDEIADAVAELQRSGN
jgi:hypothetical protein